MLLQIYSARLSCLEEAAPCSLEGGSVCTQEQCTCRHVSNSGGTCRLHSSQTSRHFPVKSFHASSLLLCLKHETKYLETSNASVSCVDQLSPRMSKTSVSKPVLPPPPSIDDGSQIHERSVSLRFLGIILRVLRLDLNHREGDVLFCHVFLLSFLQCKATEL
jgi:hypothetical protein